MQKRIDFNRYDKPAVETVGGGAITGSLKEVMCQSLELKNVIALVQQAITVMWVSDGRWSMHQLLMSLLDITGPADVHISSYALSETPARYLVQLKDTGLIRRLCCVLDNRVDTRTAGTLQVIRSIADEFSLVDTHAKVTVVINESWSIAVIGSANYTENKRYESGVIITTAEAAQFQLAWIKKALKDGVK